MNRKDRIFKKALRLSRRYDWPDNSIKYYTKGFNDAFNLFNASIKDSWEDNCLKMLDSQQIFKNIFSATLKDKLKKNI